ncbi:unnamed protein product [Vitrella brassicaformis CCMP3155]|uniref:Protein kinase domain-containing protein n=1 Tax=Vitrella brassicaformis (strain CCMP3155) TaxID=1169540 RepID=A0A0G4GZX7_VITBC|nr:unnamed protein product [Vitrella brassicaformis CCMP3155]|eukprot:CEM36836.1 unnamed protein product [Vitrella brassicaformis CCMP3155]
MSACSEDGCAAGRPVSPNAEYRRRGNTALGWLCDKKGLTVDFAMPPRVGRFGTVVSVSDAAGRRWAVKLLTHEILDANRQLVDGFYRTGNDLWAAECRERSPPSTIIRVEDIFHIPMPIFNVTPNASDGHPSQQDSGETPHGITAYKMEWIDKTLGELEGPLSERALVAIAEGVVRAVEYLGGSGLIHGDIHESNIGVRGPTGGPDQHEYEPVLLDMDRLHKQGGDIVFSIPEEAEQQPGVRHEPPGDLSAARDVQNAARCLIQELKRLGATQRLIDVLEFGHEPSCTLPQDCAFEGGWVVQVYKGLCELGQKIRKEKAAASRAQTKEPPKGSVPADEAASACRKNPPMSPPSVWPPASLTPQLDAARPINHDGGPDICSTHDHHTSSSTSAIPPMDTAERHNRRQQEQHHKQWHSPRLSA